MEKPIAFNAKECPECNIPKGWGHEIIFENNEKYCGKLLVFKKGCKFSMHYHMIIEGDAVRQIPGQPHQLEALTDGTVFEASTQHFDSDSYRVWKGNSQNK